MRRIFLLLLICITVVSISAKPSLKSDSLNILYQKNAELSNELSKTKLEIEYTKSLVQTGNGVISNQLSSSQHTLSSLSIIFTVIGIILAIAIPFGGWYITRLSHQVTGKLEEANAILKTITTLKTEVEKIETDVNTTKDLIQNNLSLLYQSLQNEEIKSIFERLKKEPVDIQHSFSKLTTVVLPDSYFKNLKEIYKKVEGRHEVSPITALNLISQHFPSQAFNDNEILLLFKKYCMDVALYPTELPKYHKALCDFVADKDIKEHLDLFKNSIIGCELSKSNLEERVHVIFDIWNNCLNENNKQALISFIENETDFLSFKTKMKNWKDILNSK